MSSEREKYVKVWKNPDYRVASPAERHMPQLVKIFCPDVGESLIDWGCGTGRASYELWKQLGMDVTMVDIAYNALDQKVVEAARSSSRLRFITHDISESTDLTADYSLCCDVMEHLPPDQVDKTLDNIIGSSEHTLFVIATFEEHTQPDLHLSVHGYRWWLRKICSKPVIVKQSAEYKYYKDDELHDHIYAGSHAVFYLKRYDLCS